MPRSSAEVDATTRIATLRHGSTRTDVEGEETPLLRNFVLEANGPDVPSAMRDQIKERDFGGADAPEVLFFGVDVRQVVSARALEGVSALH